LLLLNRFIAVEWRRCPTAYNGRKRVKLQVETWIEASIRSCTLANTRFCFELLAALDVCLKIGDRAYPGAEFL